MCFSYLCFMKKKILITGATGNVGEAVIRFLIAKHTDNTIIAGVRNIEKSRSVFNNYPHLEFRTFDFENPETFDVAFKQIDTLFLLRPPHISDVDQVFAPLIASIEKHDIKNVVFLSVQGADKMSFIPHAKIEKLITSSSLHYCFLRPSYFMQNLITTLLEDIKDGCIVLPAGKAKFNWVDVDNIGEVTALILSDFDRYSNQTIEITGSENLSFSEAVDIVNRQTGQNLKFKSPCLFSFFRYKRKQGVANAMIMVMIMLHFLPRLQKPPRISPAYNTITGKEPTSLAEFADLHMCNRVNSLL